MFVNCTHPTWNFSCAWSHLNVWCRQYVYLVWSAPTRPHACHAKCKTVV